MITNFALSYSLVYMVNLKISEVLSLTSNIVVIIFISYVVVFLFLPLLIFCSVLM
jgi:hypothetical protein